MIVFNRPLRTQLEDDREKIIVKLANSQEGLGRKQIRDLVFSGHIAAGSDRLDQALESLVDDGTVITFMRKTGGRSAEVYQLKALVRS